MSEDDDVGEPDDVPDWLSEADWLGDVVEDGEKVSVCDGVAEILTDDVGDLEKVIETEPVNDRLVE